MKEIQFKEHNGGYRERTIENIKQSHITIAIAKDFNSAGEILTKNQCTKLGKLYFPVPWDSFDFKHSIDLQSKTIYPDLVICNTIVNKIISRIPDKSVIINIAGNGIYTLKCSQQHVNGLIFSLIAEIMRQLAKKSITIELIRSGGQTGVDEAGIKAAQHLNIPSICLAPKGWLFRDINHKDISNEELFKNRFIN